MDLSVCVPDCAFASEEEYLAVEKGECYAGSITYSIGADGCVKTCQCDIKTYGNILRDDFGEIYARMSEWRDGGVIPEECSGCNREFTCRGGCRVEAYARGKDRRTLPEFAEDQAFRVAGGVDFLRDAECVMVSAGICAVHLTNEFAEWLESNPKFRLSELEEAAGVDRETLNMIMNMLAKYGIIDIDS